MDILAASTGICATLSNGNRVADNNALSEFVDNLIAQGPLSTQNLTANVGVSHPPIRIVPNSGILSSCQRYKDLYGIQRNKKSLVVDGTV